MLGTDVRPFFGIGAKGRFCGLGAVKYLNRLFVFLTGNRGQNSGVRHFPRKRKGADRCVLRVTRKKNKQTVIRQSLHLSPFPARNGWSWDGKVCIPYWS